MINYELLPKTVNDFINYIRKNKEFTNDTINNYSNDIYLFLRFIKKYKKLKSYKKISELEVIDLSKMSIRFIGKITLQDINSFLQWLSDRNNSTSTKDRRIYSLKNFFEYLIKYNLIKENLMNKVDVPKVHFKEEAYLDKEESLKLLDIVKNNCKTLRDYCIINILLNMGLRNMELRKVSIKDINFKTQELRVLGKGNKEEFLKIPNSTMEIIKGWINEREEKYVDTNKIQEGYEDFLFLSSQCKNLESNSLQYIVKKYYDLAGFKKERLCVHSLRHSFITRIYNETKDIEKTRRIARHSSITTTQRYIHINKEETNQTIEDFSL